MSVNPINSGCRMHRSSSLFQTPAKSRLFSSGTSSLVWVQKRIKVQLRTDHPIYGKQGKVIRVKPGHMRQRLYPAGEALYCARDGIPMHHFQPESRPHIKVPPPGLSRPLNDLLQRLGLGQEFNENEIKAAQAQIDRWKYSANSPTSLSTSPEPITQNLPSLLPILKEIDQHLKKTCLDLDSTRQPLLVFKRTGPENSDTLYSSIKLDELISKIVEALNFKSENLDNKYLSSTLTGNLKVLGRSDPMKNIASSENNSNGDKIQQTEEFSEFKPIKSIGNYMIFVSVSSLPLQPGDNFSNGCHKLLIKVEK